VVAFILHPLWKKEDGFVTPKLHEGWVSYTVAIFFTMVDQNAIEDELLQFFRKERQFARKAVLFRDPMLQLVSWWEKFGRHVLRLQIVVLGVLSHDCSVSICEKNWSIWDKVETKKRNTLSIL